MTHSVPLLTISTVRELFLTQAENAILKEVHSLKSLFKVQGTILELPSTNYSKHYGVMLQDLNDSSQVISCIIPSALINELSLKVGSTIEGIGKLHVKIFDNRNIVFSIDFSQITLIKQKKSTIADTSFSIKNLNVQRKTFPNKQSLNVCVIHPNSENAKVHKDFLNSVNQLENVKCKMVNVNITDKSAIITAVKNHPHADIICIIRGGGDNAQFEVFNDPALLDVITKQKAFILTGLGHTGNNTLLDLIADFSAPTPSLAGTYLLNQYQLHHNSLSIQLTTHTISKEHDSLKTMLIISLVINALLFFFK